MDKIIKLRSRYDNVLSQLIPLNNDNHKTYKFTTNGDYIRCGYNESGILFIDPPGGGMLMKGTKINDSIIKDIVYSYDLESYVVTFE